MERSNIYQKNGFEDRSSYLSSLADEYGTNDIIVSSMAEMLGENEDFDGLVCALEDFSFMQ